MEASTDIEGVRTAAQTMGKTVASTVYATEIAVKLLRCVLLRGINCWREKIIHSETVL